MTERMDMIYREEQMDLFNVPNDYALVHCISSDFALGAGIAKIFRDKYAVKDSLTELWNGYHWNGHGTCLITDSSLAENGTGNWLVCNLVTKERYWHKPTYQTLKESLYQLKANIPNNQKLAMPLIGCGLDKLNWDIVREIIFDVFRDTNVEILVCHI